jgi:hypothetical protein
MLHYVASEQPQCKAAILSKVADAKAFLPSYLSQMRTGFQVDTSSDQAAINSGLRA